MMLTPDTMVVEDTIPPMLLPKGIALEPWLTLPREAKEAPMLLME